MLAVSFWKPQAAQLVISNSTGCKSSSAKENLWGDMLDHVRVMQLIVAIFVCNGFLLLMQVSRPRKVVPLDTQIQLLQVGLNHRSPPGIVLIIILVKVSMPSLLCMLWSLSRPGQAAQARR